MTDSTLPALIQQMLQPDFYPHPVGPSALPNGEPIQLVQTHVSYVLLTGEYAYKVKKPVNFGFLDYSTLEKRQHFCEEELRLNQRAAAELYLEVLPITIKAESAPPCYQLEGDGEIADYVVKMRQFPQETLLSNLFEQDQLTEALVRELAQVMAQFHAKTTTNDYIRQFGEVDQIRQAFDENFEQTTSYIGGPQTQEQFDETQAYCDRFFETQQALFASRVQHDRIRECHGDLHLRNICRWHDQFYLFDCIEFNEPFRFVDVMFDVAYIVMDLEARQRSDLNAAFLSTYTEQTGDWEGLRVLPIYVSRQTYVRAKVTSFLLNDPSVPEAEKQKAFETAALYYRLAWNYTQPRQGRVILMSGLSGSGKSTTARAVAKALGAIQIRSDAVRKHLGGVPLEAWGSADLYSPEMTQKTYGRLLELGIQLAEQGYTVVLDAKYDRQAWREAVILEAKAHQLPLHILHCDAPLEVLRDRLNQRQTERLEGSDEIADATADLLAQQYLEPFTETEQPYVATLDTTKAIDLQISKVFNL